MLRDTVSLTMLQGGYKINVIPERAEAGLDCRLLPDTDEDAFLAEVRRSLKDDPITVEVLDRSVPASISPFEGPFFAALRASLLKRVPGSVVVPLLLTGATDASLYACAGSRPMARAPLSSPGRNWIACTASTSASPWTTCSLARRSSTMSSAPCV